MLDSDFLYTRCHGITRITTLIIREADYPYGYRREHRAPVMASAAFNAVHNGQLKNLYTFGMNHLLFTELQLCVR